MLPNSTCLAACVLKNLNICYALSLAFENVRIYKNRYIKPIYLFHKNTKVK